jgi:predicted phage baseplate assembly protein
VSLDVPNLDDRTYADILEDARRLVPVHAEEWTDHNATDPGITILELLAWLAESYGYQLDRVTDRHVRKFLTLMAAGPEAPTRATASLTAAPRVPTHVPEGEALLAVVGPDRTEPFETTTDAYLTTATLAHVVSDHSGGRVDNTEANETRGMYFLAFDDRPVPGSAMYLGFDGDPFGDENGTRLDALDLAVEFYEQDIPAPATHGEETSTFEPSVELEWQYCQNYAEWYAPGSWTEFDVQLDGTNRLYGSGTVRLARPAVWAPSAWGVDTGSVLDRERGLYWIRALLTVPESSDGRGAGYEVPPQLASISLNVLRVRHGGVVSKPETLVRADDPAETGVQVAADQRFAFAHRPVRSDELVVTIAEGGETGGGVLAGSTSTDNAWRRVETFDASGPDDEHFVLDESAGELVFGDGWRGKIPAANRRVVAEAYRFGGGDRGNVPATATWRFERGPLSAVDITPQGPASGGRPAQTTAEALHGLKEDLATRYRAVTAADFAAVAVQTPGLRFGRAHAWIDERESTGDCAGQREVTVVVVPYSTRTRPEPSGGFLEAVEAHLCRHRLLTDRVTVEPPVYVGIEVDVEVRLVPGGRPSERIAAVESALDTFLAPLPTDERDGWPFGRSVYYSELYEVVEAVDGVDCVLDVAVVAHGSAFDIGRDGTVHIPKNGLVYPMGHDVTVRTGDDICDGGVR